MKIPIEQIKITDRIRKNVMNIELLAEDIRQNGLINPITVMVESGEHKLLAGLRRLKAAQMLGWTEIAVNVVVPEDAEAALRVEYSENAQREAFTFSDTVKFARALWEIESARAKKRVMRGKKTDDPPPPVAGGRRGETREIVAAKLGIGKTTLESMLYIAEHASQEIIEQLDRGELAIKPTYKELRAKEKATLRYDAVPPQAETQAEVTHYTPEDVSAKTEIVEIAAEDESSAFNEAMDASDELPDENLPFDFDMESDTTSPEDTPAFVSATSPAPEPAPLIDDNATNIHADNTQPDDAPESEPEPINDTQPINDTPPKQKRGRPRKANPMDLMSKREQEAIRKNMEFDALPPEGKIVELKRQLKEERARAASAESDLTRERELRYNDNYHKDGTIDNLKMQLRNLENALANANARIEELESLEK